MIGRTPERVRAAYPAEMRAARTATRAGAGFGLTQPMPVPRDLAA